MTQELGLDEARSIRVDYGRLPATELHPQGYVYDLWLVERLADRLGA
ncbi:MAG: hypothetical protein ACM3QU_09895 [Verrucomicrobiota bacterium]